MIAGGPKGCAYGCLGLGSCARSCPFGAIEIVNGLAVVHKELCVGCGKCASVCPGKLIKIVDADAEVHVYLQKFCLYRKKFRGDTFVSLHIIK